MKQKQRLLKVIREKLESLGVGEAISWPESLQPDAGHKKVSPSQPFFTAAEVVCIAGHFEVYPDLFVVDPLLRSMGLIFVLEGSSSGDAIRHNLSAASVLRHELSASGSQESISWPVEVVFVVARQARPRLVQELQAIAQDSTLLHFIGVNVLCFSGGRHPFSLQEFHRAFPWLLAYARDWYRSQAKSGVQSGNPKGLPRRLRGVRLDNYRLPGKRTLKFDKEAAFHLVHGHNGSGKSSLAEAFEVSLTGRIERLDRSRYGRDYGEVVKYQHSDAAAKVRLEWNSGDPSEFEVYGTPPIETPVRPSSEANSQAFSAVRFRLDQSVMDRLTTQSDVERAETLLSAFYPEAAPIVAKFREASRKMEAAFKSLPEPIRKRFRLREGKTFPAERTIKQKFNWITRLTQIPMGEFIDELLPLPREALLTLARMHEGMRIGLDDLEKRSKEILSSKRLSQALSAIDTPLEALRQGLGPTLRDIEESLDALSDLEGWRAARSKAVSGTLEDTLNDWLEHHILIDMAEKQLSVGATFVLAEREKGWGSAEALPELLSATAQASRPEEVEELRRCIEEWSEVRDERYQELTEILESGQRDESPQDSSALRRLSARQVKALDEVGGWLGIQQLGQSVQQALISGKSVRLEREDHLTVGSAGWAVALKKELLPFLSACQDLRDAEGGWMPGQLCLDACQELATALSLYGKASASLEDNLFSRLSDAKLLAALNELIALFTPAKWAYPEVELRPLLNESGELELRFMVGHNDTIAALRLNTAELNLFTIALFLLLAPLQDNPLHLLILDDPLQNMDELTAISLARGLARLIKLWPDGWQIMLLLHGEQDVERFLSEIPSRGYHIPYLTFLTDLKGKELEAERLDVLQTEKTASLTEDEVRSQIEFSAGGE